jgi:hypothetical protein
MELLNWNWEEIVGGARYCVCGCEILIKNSAGRQGRIRKRVLSMEDKQFKIWKLGK